MSLECRFSSRVGSFVLDAGFVAPARGFTALFGHSGSGKTTLLRCIAGLERGPRGYFALDGEVWQDGERFVPPHRRPVGYVFQEASLFPHLSVRQNLEYGWRRIPPAARKVQRDEAVELLGIGGLLDRGPAHLSGGERQRVAIARALLTSPRLLLMDEPLSALDERSKAEILPFLERLHAELALPVVYVSHSLKEVTRLADHMVWMEAGRVRAVGPLAEVLARQDIGVEWEGDAGEVIEATVVGHDDRYHLTELHSGWGRLRVRRIERAPGTPVRVRLPARDISLGLTGDEQSSILNVWPAVVERVAEAGSGQVLVTLQPAAGGPLPLVARITQLSCERLGLAPGVGVYARIKSVGLLD
jgi:molybdate transport system ATP-binding protein